MTTQLRRRPVRLLAAGAATLLVLAACGSKDDDGDIAVPPVQPPATSVATPSETPSAGATPSDSAGPDASASPSESATASANTIAINLVNGKPEPRLDLNQKFKEGDEITVTVTSDKAYEVHIHGYDYTLEAKPGEPASKTFTLDKGGSYEVEVEETGTKLFNLVVE